MTKLLLRMNTLFNNLNITNVRTLSATSAIVTKTKRSIFARVYPTALVLPDGSSITIRYHEPRRLITLPLDLSTLSETERKIRLDRRKPKKKVVIAEEIEDTFNANKYLQQTKKSRKR